MNATRGWGGAEGSFRGEGEGRVCRFRELGAQRPSSTCYLALAVPCERPSICASIAPRDREASLNISVPEQPWLRSWLSVLWAAESEAGRLCEASAAA